MGEVVLGRPAAVGARRVADRRIERGEDRALGVTAGAQVVDEAGAKLGRVGHGAMVAGRAERLDGRP